MSDPIKAALEAAEQGFHGPFSQALSDMLLHGKGRARVTSDTQRQCIAAAVAAFLRALPTNGAAVLMDEHAGQITSRPGIGQTGAWWAGYLAAAVERAAKDGAG
jgi:hypothetical protein